MPRTVEQISQELNPYYAPQQQLIQSQIAEIPGQTKTETSAIEQARVNAFRDIETAANRRGVLFSGFSPSEQARYTGERYAPALANLSTRMKNRQFQLQDALSGLKLKQQSQAQDIYSQEVKAEQDALKAEQDRLYKQAQLEIAYQRLNMSQANAGAASNRRAEAAQSKEMAKYKVKDKGNGAGYAFSYSGKPISLAQYVSNTGGDVNDVLDFLKNGSAYDKKVYNSVNIQLRNKKIPNTPEAILRAIQLQDSGKFYGF